MTSNNIFCINLLAISTALLSISTTKADDLEKLIDQDESESQHVASADDYSSLIKNSPFLPRDFSKQNVDENLSISTSDSAEFTFNGVMKRGDGSYVFSLINNTTKKGIWLSSDKKENADSLDVSFYSYNDDAHMLVLDGLDGLKSIKLSKKEEKPADQNRSSFGMNSYFDQQYADAFDDDFMSDDQLTLEEAGGGIGDAGLDMYHNKLTSKKE